MDAFLALAQASQPRPELGTEAWPRGQRLYDAAVGANRQYFRCISHPAHEGR